MINISLYLIPDIALLFAMRDFIDTLVPAKTSVGVFAQTDILTYSQRVLYKEIALMRQDTGDTYEV